MAIGTQIGFAIGGFAPVVAAAVPGQGPNAWVPVALLNTAICAVASIAAWTARETYNIAMHDLGGQTAAAATESTARSRPLDRERRRFAATVNGAPTPEEQSEHDAEIARIREEHAR